MPLNILVNKRYNWNHVEDEDLKCWYIGSEKAVKKFIFFCKRNPNAHSKELKEKLYNNRGNYAVIVEQKNRLIAAVDKIRSYPVFYVHDGNKFAVSNSARALKDKCSISEIDELSILEFRMAGYVTGRETLYKNLYQLQAGEFLIWDEDHDRLERERYYLFYSEDIRQESEDDLIAELDEITDRIFLRVMEEANGAPIWVPLSGGLDSRLVLCKLKQHGYDSLTAFSYGPPGNYEAKAAEWVAKKIDVPWHFFPINMMESRRFFHSDVRKSYWEFSDGLSNIPNMQDIHVLSKLKREKKLPSDVVIINGQSGDFITGGHIPSSFVDREPDIPLLFERAIDKHYSLWVNLKTKENLNKITDKIKDLIEIDREKKVDLQKLASLYEWWEWQERQCKYVINGQRIYDFFNLKWFLPLWDDNYLKFWENIPLEQKYNQKLYRQYLYSYDYNGLFRGFSPVIWRWPGSSIAIVPLARLVHLLFGRRYKEKLYKYASYFGHYRAQYSGYSFKYFLNKITNARNPVSFYVDTWLMENGISYDLE